MSEPLLPREVRRRLAIIQHAEEVTGNVAMTCRYYGISRPTYYTWLRRYREQGIDGLRDLSRRPRHSPNATRVEVVGRSSTYARTTTSGRARSRCTSIATTTLRYPNPVSGASSSAWTSTSAQRCPTRG